MDSKIELEKYSEVERWLTGKSRGSKFNYLSALRAFIEYTKLNPKELIDLAEADRKKSARERGEPERKVKSFFDWLIKDYEQKSRGAVRKRRKNGKKGVSRNLASMYCNAIRSFYKENGFPLVLKIPKSAPKKVNFKLKLRIPEVKRLLDVASNIRDRAIILTLFQSGMSISELCNLTYGDVAKGLEENEEPLHLHLIRKKELVEYDTFLGSDAIEMLKTYLDERRRNGEILKHDSPLFIKRFIKSNNKNKVEKIYPSLIEAAFRSLALKSGLVTEEQLEKADINPCRPHALRSSFVSILKTAGMNNTVVEYLSGHTINQTEKAYWMARPDELKNLYKKYQKYLSISGMIDSEKLETLEQETKKRDDLIEVLLENGKMKDRKIEELSETINRVKADLADFKHKVSEQLTKQLEIIAKLPSEHQQEYIKLWKKALRSKA